MKNSLTILTVLFLLCPLMHSQDGAAPQKNGQTSDNQIRIEKNGAVVGNSADKADLSDREKPWVAVHDFTVDPSLAEWGINGWDIAEKFENELVQRGYYRMVTRAKIAKVLKEQKISSSGALDPSKFGAIVGAEFIVTGQIDKKGSRITVIAKLIDAKKETGEVEKSFDSSIIAETKEKGLERINSLVEHLAKKLSMTSSEFLEHGLSRMKLEDYEEAAEAFEEILRNSQNAEIKNLLEKAKEGAKKRAEHCQKEINEAAKAFKQAVENQAEIMAGMSPAELCDLALSKLEGLVSDPRLHLTFEERSFVDELILKIKEFRKGIFTGPVKGKLWAVPDLNMKFVPVKPGVFGMGVESSASADNKLHTVTISADFWMGVHEVTIEQFLFYLQNPNNDTDEPKKVDKDKEISWTNEYCPITKEYKMKSGTGDFWGDQKQPVVGINWRSADMFCKWLTKRENLAKRLPAGYEYRLPTEAEWEYSCRAFSSEPSGQSLSATVFCFGNDREQLADYAWYKFNGGGKTHSVGAKKSNVLGMFDMHGNVWEWCYDWYDGPYIDFDVKDPKGSDASADNLKVLRGGSFLSDPEDLECAKRHSLDYKSAKKNVGFRVVCGPKL